MFRRPSQSPCIALRRLALAIVAIMGLQAGLPSLALAWPAGNAAAAQASMPADCPMVAKAVAAPVSAATAGLHHAPARKAAYCPLCDIGGPVAAFVAAGLIALPSPHAPRREIHISLCAAVLAKPASTGFEARGPPQPALLAAG